MANPIQALSMLGNGVMDFAKRRKIPFSTFGGPGGYNGTGYGYGMGYPYQNLPGTNVDYAAIAGKLWQNPSAAACLLAITDAFAQATPYLEHRENDEWERVESHPLTDLLWKPNQFYSAKQLWGLTIVSEKSQGAAFWRFDYNKGNTRPVQMWFEPPRIPNTMVSSSSIAPTWDANSFISGYVLWVDGQPYPMEPTDAIYFRSLLNLENPRLPWNPLGMGVREIAQLNAASTFSAGLLRNGAVPALAISAKADSGVDVQKIQDFMKKFIQSFTGDGAGGVHGTGLPLDIHKVGYSPEELALDKLQSWPQQLVCALLRTPAEVALLPCGDDHKTFNNLGEANRWWWDNCIIPMEDAHGEEIQTQMFPLFDLGTNEYRINWDRSNVRALQDDQEELAKRAQLLYDGGILDLDEARQLLGKKSDPKFVDVFAKPQQTVDTQTIDGTHNGQAQSSGTQPEIKSMVEALERVYTSDKLSGVFDNHGATNGSHA